MQNHVIKIIMLGALLGLPACNQSSGKPASWGPSRWETGVRPPEKLNRNDSYQYQSQDDYCTPELKKVGGC